MLKFLPRRWHIPHAWWERLARWQALPARPIESIVIPCAGAAYVEEGKLCAAFAARHMTEAREIVLATDQPAEAFGSLPRNVRVETMALPAEDIPAAQEFPLIWRSRLIKLQAPLRARRDPILMIDSDLMLLKSFRATVVPGAIYGSLYRGKIGHRLKPYRRELPDVRRSPRVWVKYHLNGGLLLADRATWRQLSPLWLRCYQELWRRLPAHLAPVDQIPLVMALDALRFLTIDLGPNVNWSVPKRIGDQEVVLPGEVIGAHGGFPLSEWEKYLQNPRSRLCFKGESYTRKVRYQR